MLLKDWEAYFVQDSLQRLSLASSDYNTIIKVEYLHFFAVVYRGDYLDLRNILLDLTILNVLLTLLRIRSFRWIRLVHMFFFLLGSSLTCKVRFLVPERRSI